MNGKIKFFAEADSALGHVSYMVDRVDEAKKVIILENMTKKASKLIFGQIEKVLSEKRMPYKSLLACGEEERCSAIASEGYLFINKENMPGSSCGMIIDFSDCYGDYLDAKLKEELTLKEKEEREKMFLNLSFAKKIHDEWEKIYIENMDFDILAKKTESLISDIFTGKPVKNKAGKNERGFFGTMLPHGNVNYIDELTKNLKRILIKGRPGTGKSTILKKIRKEALDRGYSVESFYCSFDPVSLDMILIREIGLAVFDATSPHEKVPAGDDEVFDVYDIAVKKGTDEFFERELSSIKKRYDSEILEAKRHLYLAQNFALEKEKVLSESLDYSRIEKTLRELEKIII